MKNDYMSGFEVDNDGLTISQLQFVDDTLIFCGADLD